MDMSQIKNFIVVAEYLNFSRAAERLYISQPALSRQISKIENELNCQLFIRGTRSLELTHKGKNLLEEFKKIYSSFNLALMKNKCGPPQMTGTLNIGVLDGMIIGDLLSVPLKRFSELYPEINLGVCNCDYKEIAGKLNTGELDLAFSLRFDVEQYNNLCIKVIDNTQCRIVLNTSHRYFNTKKARLADFLSDPFILVDRENSRLTHALIVEACRRDGFEPEIIFVPTRNAQMLWAQINKGVCIFDTRNQLITDPGLNFVELENYICDPSLTMVWNKNNTNFTRDLFDTILLSFIFESAC